MDERSRAVLEAIAYGDEVRVTPADRLRALQELGVTAEPADPGAAARALPLEQAVAELDQYLAARLAGLLHGGAEAEQWPELAEGLRRVVEVQVEVRVRVRTAALDAEVEQRALALYAERGVQQAQAGLHPPDSPQVATGTNPHPSSGKTPAQAPQPPPGLTPQNLFPRGFSAPQFEQVITTRA